MQINPTSSAPLPIIRPQPSLIAALRRFQSRLLYCICFWKWFKGSSLSERQIRILQARADAKIIPSEVTFQRFQLVLKKKISLVVTTINNKQIAESIQSAKSTLLSLPDHFSSLLDLAENLTKKCNRKSPLIELIDQPAIIENNELSKNLLTWLIPKVLPPQVEETIRKESLASFTQSQKSLSLPLAKTISSWLFQSDRSKNLLEYVEAALPAMKDMEEKQKKKDIHFILRLYLITLFESKKRTHDARLRQLTPESIETLITDMFHTSAGNVTDALSQRLVAIFKGMEPDFDRTFDSIVDMLHPLVSKSSIGSAPERITEKTYVANKEEFLKAVETRAYDSMAEAVIAALFPEGLSELEAHVQIPEELTTIIEEGKKITEQMLPKDFLSSSNGYITGLLSTILGSRSTVMHDQLKKGLTKAFKSVITLFFDPKEQAALMGDSILPSVNETLKKTFIKQFLETKNHLLSILLSQLYVGSIDIEDIVSTLFNLFKQDSSTITDREEFKTLLIPFIEKNQELMRAISESPETPLNPNEVLNVLRYRTEPKSEARDLIYPNPYLGVIVSLVHNFAGFGRFVHWILNFKFIQNTISNSVLTGIAPYRKSPAGILEDSITSLDESLSEAKIVEILNEETLETLSAKEGRFDAELAKLQGESQRLKEKLDAIKEKLSNQGKPLKKQVKEELLLEETRLSFELKRLTVKIKSIVRNRDDNKQKLLALETKQASYKAIDKSDKVAKEILKISQTLFDLIIYNLKALGGLPAVFIVKKFIGSNHSYLHSVISAIYKNALVEKQNILKETLNKVLRFFVSKINPKAHLDSVPTAKDAENVEENPFTIKGCFNLPPVRSSPSNSLSLQQSEMPQVPIIAPNPALEGIPQALKAFVDHLTYYIQKKFIAPNVQSFDTQPQLLLEQLKSFPKFLIGLTNKESSEAQINQLKKVNLKALLPGPLNALLDKFVYTDDLKKAQELAAILENDEEFAKTLSIIPCKSKKDLENYTVLTLKWIFSFQNERSSRSCFSQDPDKSEDLIVQHSLESFLTLHLDPTTEIDLTLANQVYETSLNFIIAARTKQIVDYAKSSMQQTLQTRLEKILKTKSELVLNILNERLNLVVEAANDRYTQVIDGTARVINNTIVANKTIRESLGDAFNDEDFVKAFTEQKVCHRVFKNHAKALEKYADRDPTRAKELFIERHYRKKAIEVVEFLFPRIGQQENGVLAMVQELKLDQDIRKWLAPIKELLSPFLSPESANLIEEKQETLLKGCERIAADYLRNIFIDGINDAIKQGIATLSPSFIQQQLSETVLPSLQESLLKMLLKETFLMNLKSSAKENEPGMLIISIRKGGEEGNKARERLIGNMHKHLASALPNFTITLKQYGILANKFLNEVLIAIAQTATSSSQDLEPDDICEIIQEHFARQSSKEETPEAESAQSRSSKPATNQVYGEIITNILQVGQVGKIVEYASSFNLVKQQITTAICGAFEEPRSSPKALFKGIASALNGSIAKKEVVRDMLLGTSKSSDSLEKAKEQLEARKARIQQLKNDPKVSEIDKELLAIDLEELNRKLDDLSKLLIEAKKKKLKKEEAKTEALSNLSLEIMQTANIIYDFVNFLPKIMTKDMNFLAKNATLLASHGLVTLFVGANPGHLHDILDRVINQTLLSKGIVTESTLMRVTDIILRLFESKPAQKFPSSSSHDVQTQANLNVIKLING